jgi:hypothetical protein
MKRNLSRLKKIHEPYNRTLIEFDKKEQKSSAIYPTCEMRSSLSVIFDCMKNQLLFKIESKLKMNRKNRRISE